MIEHTDELTFQDHLDGKRDKQQSNKLIVHAGDQSKNWLVSFFYSIPIIVLVLGLFYYWFGIADRDVIFLYNYHEASLYPDTKPFGHITASRYWMSGLVACGAVFFLYSIIQLILARFHPNYRAPSINRIWVICAGAFFIGLLIITMTVNNPTLPLDHAILVVFTTNLGLGLALISSRFVVEHTNKLIWLAVDGFGLILIMQSLLLTIDLFSEPDCPGFFCGLDILFLLPFYIIIFVFGVMLLAGVTFFLIRFKVDTYSMKSILISYCCFGFLIFPFLGYLLSGGGGLSIPDSEGIIVHNVPLQVFLWLVILLGAYVATNTRRYLEKRKSDAKI